MQNVKIGAEFFAKAKLDYSNWKEAWIREVFQNAADSGASVIRFDYIETDFALIAAVTDNGRGMSREVLEDKLFSLGSSGKDFKEGAVGGFGKAKELLYFSQHGFVIETNELKVEGSGGQYSIEQLETPRIGTKSIVTISDGGELQKWVELTKTLVERSAFRGRVYIDGVEVLDRSLCGEEVRTLPCGVLYYNTNKNLSNVLVFRVNGSPMFTRTIKNLNKGLIFEISQPSQMFLTSNRDHLQYPGCTEVDAFVGELTIDKKSALLKKNAFVRKYEGRKGRLCRPRQTKPEYAAVTLDKALNDVLEPRIYNPSYTSVKLSAEVIQSIYSEYNFVLHFAKSEKLPEKWQLGTFSENALFVVWAWSVAVWDIFCVDRKEPDFDFGFVFDDNCEARYTSSTFLINPAHTDYRIKYTRSREDCCKILTFAAHEYVHHLGFSYHDEEYSGAFTDLMCKVMSGSPHTITRMLDKEAQARLDYCDYESQRRLALAAVSKKPIKRY